MRKEKLSTLCDVKNGYAFKSSDYVDSGYRVIRITNVQKGVVVDDDPKFISTTIAAKANNFKLDLGDILISLTGNVGRVGRIKECHLPAVLNQRVGLIRPHSEELDHTYLFQYLNSGSFENEAISNSNGVAQLNLSSKWVENHQIPLPPLEDQKRIAHLLGKVEGLVARRKQHLQQLDDLLKSVFLVIFGDHTAMRQQQHFLLGEFIEFLTSGSRGWAKYYSDTGSIFLRIKNVKDARLKLDDIVYVNAPNSAEANRTRVRAGDLLLSITADLGRTAVVSEELDGSYINQHLALIRIKSEAGFNPLFLAWYFSLPYGNSFIQKKNREGVKAGLNFDDIRSFQVVKPPIDLQNQFAAIVEKVEGIKSHYQQSLTDLKSLYGTLSQKAFKGELDLSRVPLPVEAITEDTESTETQRKPKPLTQGFARQLLAAEILHRHNGRGLTQMKLQKVIHLIEHHAELDEIQGNYQRQAAGPYDNKMMYGIASSLKKQRWFETNGRGQSATYSSLTNAGGHKKYLSHWQEKMVKIDEVLGLLGRASPAQCEIASTLYAAWNDLLIDGEEISDERIIEQASKAELWHKTKEAIEPDKWPKALQWMHDHNLVPTGYGKRTRKLQ